MSNILLIFFFFFLNAPHVLIKTPDALYLHFLDNKARKGSRGHAFVNASPVGKAWEEQPNEQQR